MNNFEKRRDRFEFFESFENPLLNLTFKLEVQDFLPFCKTQNLPPFHFFLYCLNQALMKNENFHYRLYQGKVIKIEKIIASYTVMNEEGLFNYTKFENTSDRELFIQRSLAARDETVKSRALINTGIELSEREMKDYVFITSIPWLDFTSIQHPVFKFKSADIPSVAWGKFTPDGKGKISLPLSIQAHHGFVDGYHIHLLAESIKNEISSQMEGKK